MKKVYVQPIVEGMEITTNYGIMIGASGEIDPGHGMAKEQDFIFDDEDDEVDGQVAATQSFHSNDYLKEVWE
jgi:hypothetical protein